MTTNPKDTYTVEDFVAAGSGVVITYNNLSYLERLSDNSMVPTFNVLSDYIDELLKLSVNVEFSDAEYLKYMYKPKLLAHDIYKNPELFFVILLINGICDVKEFTKKKIKMIPVDRMDAVLTYIYNAEKESIDNYNNK